MPAPVLVDSGAWIGFFSRRDEHHAEADRLVRRALQRKVPLLTTSLIVAEVHRLILHRVGVRAAAAVLDRIDGSPAVEIVFPDGAHHEAARRWLARLGDQSISYTDAVSFAVMEQRRCAAVLGFDRDFTVAGFVRWAG